MQALFVELLAFARHRAEYLDDEGFRAMQTELLATPEQGDVIKGTGGLRKRASPTRRGARASGAGCE